MKHLFIAIIIPCLLSLSIKQTINKLDDKNGFKTFTFGDKYSKYATNLKFFSHSESSGLDIYVYQGDEVDLHKVYNTKFYSISLCFNKENSLSMIYLSNPFFVKDDSAFYQHALEENHLLSKLYTADIGAATGIIDENGVTGSVWVGKKVILKVTTAYYGFDKGAMNTVSLELTSLTNKGEGF